MVYLAFLCYAITRTPKSTSFCCLLSPLETKIKIEIIKFFNGEVTFMSKRHIKCAFPASVFLIIVTIIPPVLLFSYPLCYKILALCRLQESKFTKLLCKCIPLEKYKPVFDSFQSTFKDEYRYFAGLHFMFTCFVLALFLLHKDLINIYVILDLLFLIMLTLHASLQHNILDTLIFSLLIVLEHHHTFQLPTTKNMKQRSRYCPVHYVFPGSTSMAASGLHAFLSE